MPYGNDGMTAIEVEVFLALAVPDLATLSFHDVHVEQGINIKKFHILFILTSEYLLFRIVRLV